MWAGGGGGDRGAQGRKGQLALCLHAVPGWEAGVCPEGPGGRTVSYTCAKWGSTGGVGLFEVLLSSNLASYLRLQDSACLICVMSRYLPIQAIGERRETGSRDKAKGWHTGGAKAPAGATINNSGG